MKEDFKFYLEIWKERLHICYETDQPLGDEINLLFFHHILNKQHYPQFRHSKWNIVLLSKDIHQQVESNIDKCPKVKDLTKQTKEKHG